MVTIKQVRWKNIFSYVGEHMIDLKKGYTSIIGPNGHGKSNLGLIVPWILFGSKGLEHKKESEVVSKLCSERPEGWLTLDDGSVVYRSLTTASFINEKGETLANSKTGVAEVLDSKYNLSSIVAMTWMYVGQDDLKNIIDRDVTLRLKTIEAILKMSNFSKIDPLITKHISDLKDKLLGCQVENYIEAKTKLEFLNKQHGNLINGLSAKEKEKNMVLNQYSKLKIKLDNSNKLVETVKKLDEDKQELESRIVLFEDRKKECEKNLSELGTLINQISNEIKNKSDESKVCIDVKKKFEKFKSEKEIIKKEIIRKENLLFSLTSKIDTLETQVTINTKPKTVKPDEDEYRKLQEQTSEAVFNMNTNRVSINELKRLIQACEEDSGGKCSRCGTTLSEEHIESLELELSKKSDELKDTIRISDHLKNKCESMEQILISWDRYEQRLDLNQELEKEINPLVLQQTIQRTEVEELKKKELVVIQNYDSVMVVIETNKEKMEELDRLDSRKKQIMVDSETTVSKIKSYTGTLESVRVEYEKIKNKISKHRTLDVLEQEKMDLIGVVRSTKDHVDRLISEQARLNRDLHNSSTDLNNAQIIYDREKIVYNKQQGLRDEIKLVQNSRIALKGFRKSCQSKILPRAQKYLNEIYQFLETGQYDHLALDEEFNIIGYKNSEMFDFNYFSGGQKNTAALALRIGLAKAKQILTGESIGTVILDEPTASFDDDRKPKFKNLILKLTGLIPQILCITHCEELKNPQQTIRVIMKDGRSTVIQQQSKGVVS